MTDILNLWTDMDEVRNDPDFPDLFNDLLEIDSEYFICAVRRTYVMARLSGWPQEAAAMIVIKKLQEGADALEIEAGKNMPDPSSNIIPFPPRGRR